MRSMGGPGPKRKGETGISERKEGRTGPPGADLVMSKLSKMPSEPPCHIYVSDAAACTAVRSALVRSILMIVNFVFYYN